MRRSGSAASTPSRARHDPAGPPAAGDVRVSRCRCVPSPSRIVRWRIQRLGWRRIHAQRLSHGLDGGRLDCRSTASSRRVAAAHEGDHPTGFLAGQIEACRKRIPRQPLNRHAAGRATRYRRARAVPASRVAPRLPGDSAGYRCAVRRPGLIAPVHPSSVTAVETQPARLDTRAPAAPAGAART